MQKFWDPDRLLSSGASYNIAIGHACVGKSFAMRKKIIEHYITTGEQSTYILRFNTGIMHTAKYLFDQFNGYIISTLTNDKFDSTDTQVILLDNFRRFDLTFLKKMGVTGIRSQYPGTIDYYILNTGLNTGLKIAAEVISG